MDPIGNKLTPDTIEKIRQLNSSKLPAKNKTTGKTASTIGNDLAKVETGYDKIVEVLGQDIKPSEALAKFKKIFIGNRIDLERAHAAHFTLEPKPGFENVANLCMSLVNLGSTTSELDDDGIRQTVTENIGPILGTLFKLHRNSEGKRLERVAKVIDNIRQAYYS